MRGATPIPTGIVRRSRAWVKCPQAECFGQVIRQTGVCQKWVCTHRGGGASGAGSAGIFRLTAWLRLGLKRRWRAACQVQRTRKSVHHITDSCRGSNRPDVRQKVTTSDLLDVLKVDCMPKRCFCRGNARDFGSLRGNQCLSRFQTRSLGCVSQAKTSSTNLRKQLPCGLHRVIRRRCRSKRNNTVSEFIQCLVEASCHLFDGFRRERQLFRRRTQNRCENGALCHNSMSSAF